MLALEIDAEEIKRRPLDNQCIRKKIRIRLRIFMREGRSERWKRINKEIRTMIRKSKKEYIAAAVIKCKETGNNAIYYSGQGTKH